MRDDGFKVVVGIISDHPIKSTYNLVKVYWPKTFPILMDAKFQNFYPNTLYMRTFQKYRYTVKIFCSNLYGECSFFEYREQREVDSCSTSCFLEIYIKTSGKIF